MSPRLRIANLIKRAVLPKNPKSCHEPAAGPVVIAGMFRTANGLGEAARRLYDALSKSDLDVRAVDTSLILHQVDFETDVPYERMPSCHKGTLILIANPPETETILFQLDMRLWKAWRIIGYWSWELQQLNSEWAEVQRYCSEIWTLSDFANAAISREVAKPVTTIPIPIPTHLIGRLECRTPSDRMLCLIMADGRSSFERKNVLGAMRMYLGAFGEDSATRLTVKLRNASRHHAFKAAIKALAARREDVEIIDLSMTDAEKWSLINDHDVVISAHRAEGFGLHLAEAMLLGKCVVATNWSGNLQFMTDENSILLPYALQSVQDDFGVYQELSDTVWADVDEKAGIAALTRLHTSKGLREKIGGQAKKDITINLSNSAVLQKIMIALQVN